MSRARKWDAYLNQLEEVGDYTVIPAETMQKLSYNVYCYQNNPKRNKLGLVLACRNVLNRQTFQNEFRVIVVGTGRWNEKPSEEV